MATHPEMLLSRSLVAQLLLVLLCAPRAAIAEDEGFVPMVEDDKLTGWVAEGITQRKVDGETKPVWTVDDGTVRCAGFGYGFLRYDTELCDFSVRLEYRMSKGCNSGLGIRGAKFTGAARTRPSFSGYELQILDDHRREPHKHGTMSLYRYVAPTANPVKPHGEWNQVEITCRGPKIKVVLNGVTVQDVDQSQIEKIAKKPLCGHFSLQNHGREIEFRNLWIKQHKTPEKPPR